MKLTRRQADALGHIRIQCQRAAEVAEGQTAQSVASDWRLQDLLIRRVEVIGEAAGRLGPEFQRDHPEFPWRQMVGMRNRLIHDYDRVNVLLLWQTVDENLPVLLGQVEAVLRAEGLLAAPGATPTAVSDDESTVGV